MPKGIRGRAVCSVDGCTNLAKGRGYCQNHLRRFKKYGDPEGSYTSIRAGRSCSADGCDRPVNAGGMCTMHYNRARLIVRGSEVCSVDGCDDPAAYAGMCGKHYIRHRKHGDVHHNKLDEYAARRDAGCTIDECDRPYRSVGLCDIHLAESYKRRDDPAYRRNPNDWRERFELHTDRCGPYPLWRPHLGRCWTLATAKPTPNGYAVTGAKRPGTKKKSWMAHRLAYELWVGDIPDGLVIDHECVNRQCINPRHLFATTQKHNMERASVCYRCEWLEQCPNCDGQLSAYGLVAPLPKRTRLNSWASRGLSVEDRFWLWAGNCDGPHSELVGSRCWDWLGPTDPNGYGLTEIDGRNERAHRLAFRFMLGVEVPDDMVVDHLCRRPSCVNARDGHLEIVTRGENSRRAHDCPRCAVLQSCPFCDLPLGRIQSAATWRTDTAALP